LIREFPEYDSYWHIASIRFGKRVYRNTNKLIDAYPGADGMKTGFICASGFNLVATATHGDRRLIAVVLGAPSSATRAVKAAALFERGFAANPLGWLMPSLGSVESLVPIAAAPPNLRDDICGNNRKRQPAEDGEEGGEAGVAAAGMADDPGGQRSFFLSSLRGPTPKGSTVLTSGLAAAIPPVDVYIGPTRNSVAPSTAYAPPVGKKKPEAITTAAKPPRQSRRRPRSRCRPQSPRWPTSRRQSRHQPPPSRPRRRTASSRGPAPTTPRLPMPRTNRPL